MVSFQCEGCGDIVKKPKCKVHRCRAPFTCIDCHQTFNGTSYMSHNQCMTEDQKYQKGYKPPTKKQQQAKSTPAAAPTQPTGLIAQLEKKKEETDKKRSLEEEENAKVEGQGSSDSNNKKAKLDTKKKAKKDKKKTKSLSEWSVDELDSNENKQMELALQYVLKKDQKDHSIEHLREQVVLLISSHPKSPKDIKSAALKSKFDQVVGLTFNTKKNKIAYTFIKN
ncbi:hypothetical protein BCR42DRAFT_486310 [Absidia repens]|uniref:Zinc finger C2H2 LYAR-type domain-containing protein n=1 Tax=Absidia repens TaxID=90262 RepID=A0A1X2IXD1_9FUNG|nr:hypothetical protein BCR42DRAFT_486310 [Absidia repens]